MRSDGSRRQTAFMGKRQERHAEPVELDEPRALTAEERDLLTYLGGGPLGKPGIEAQTEAARVVAECGCGCASVWLGVDQSMPSVTFVSEDTPDGHTDHVALTARSVSYEADVVLHVVKGRLFELEVWAGY